MGKNPLWLVDCTDKRRFRHAPGSEHDARERRV